MKLNWHWYESGDASRWIVQLNKENISFADARVPTWIWDFWDHINYQYRQYERRTS